MPTYWECEQCGHVHQDGGLSLTSSAPEECERCGNDEFYGFGSGGSVIPDLNLENFVKLCVMFVLLNLVGLVFGIALSDWGLVGASGIGVGVIVVLAYAIGRNSTIGYVAAVLFFGGGFVGALFWLVTASGLANRFIPSLGVVMTGLGLAMLWGGRSEVLRPSGA